MAQEISRVADRIRRLANFLTASDAVRVRIEQRDTDVEVGRRPRAVAPRVGAVPTGTAGDGRARVDTIKAGLVGIFRFSRPIPVEGEAVERDRELGYVEALGIRNPVHSLGAGRIVAIASTDGAAVEYGQPLFLLDRG